MRVEAEHVGMDGTPCQCTRAGRMRVRRGHASTCPCHGVRHAKCPDAHPCIGHCGRLTTAHETNACGYCPHCAADRRWIKVA